METKKNPLLPSAPGIGSGDVFGGMQKKRTVSKDLKAIQADLKPSAVSTERQRHELAVKAKIATAEDKEDVAIDQALQEAGDDELEEDQDEKNGVDRYMCYCGVPECRIGFEEGAQEPNPEGIYDRYGNRVVA